MKERILNIDLFKFIASLMIVAIHVYPLHSFNAEVDYVITRVLFRIAVPFFFMATGYLMLSSSLQDYSKLIRYTKKILKLYLLAIILYLPVRLYQGALFSNSFGEILKAFFFDGTFYHLWYFPALILGIWITYFILKKFSFKLSFFFCFVLYLVGLFGDSYFGFIPDCSFFSSIYSFLFLFFDYTRNGIFYAPIFLCLGYYFARYSYKNSFIIRFFAFISFGIMMMIEGFLLYKYNIPKHTSMYLFLIPTSYFCFSLLHLDHQKQFPVFRNLSTNIYLFHPLVILGVHFLSKISLFSFLANSLLFYLVVVLFTIVFSFMLEFIKKKFVF